jgi:hypothetical protein
MKRCAKGTRRNKKTGECEKKLIMKKKLSKTKKMQASHSEFNPRIYKLMQEFKLSVTPTHTWESWVKKNNSTIDPYYYRFHEILKGESDTEIKNMYKRIRKFKPQIIFEGLCKAFYQSKVNTTDIKLTNKKLPANLDKETIVNFLSYVLVIELPVENYDARILNLFGYTS